MSNQRNWMLWLWPLVLVAAGILLLLHNYLLLDFDVLQLWPVILIALGIQAIVRGDLGFSWATQTFGITRGSVESATLRANGGELDIHLRLIRREGRLIAGQYTAQSRPDLQVEGNHATLTMLRDHTWMFSLGDWDFALAGNLPWALSVSTHLGEIEADMRGLIIEQARLSTGIGDIHCVAPDTPAGPVELRSALGNIYLTVPERVEAAIQIKGGPMFGLRLQSDRWHVRDDRLVVTPGYDEEIEPLVLIVRGTFGDLILT